MTESTGHSYTLTRTLDAPVATVWAAWTTPDQFAQWANAVPGSVEMDVRPGGAWKATMRTPDGQEFPLGGRYVEVEENSRLFVGQDVGNDQLSVMGCTFQEKDGRTEIVVTQTSDTAEQRDMSEAGSNILLDGLAAYVARS